MAKRVRPPWAVGIEAKSSDFRAEEVLFLILGPPIGEIATRAAATNLGANRRDSCSRGRLDHIRIGAKYDMAAQELFQLGTAPFAAMTKQSDAIAGEGDSSVAETLDLMPIRAALNADILERDHEILALADAPHLAKIEALGEVKAEQIALQCVGHKLNKADLTSHCDPNVIVFGLLTGHTSLRHNGVTSIPLARA